MSDLGVVDPNVDEQRIVQAVAIGLPLVTIASAGVVGVVVGPALSILVLAAGLLLGVIGLLWSSVRILSGDAALSPELEALDMDAQGVDALASRKKMLLRAIKDLANEHAIGKMDLDDFQQLSSTYRAELKTVLQRIDDSLAPHRALAEELARKHLSKIGLTEDAEATKADKSKATVTDSPDPAKSKSASSSKPSRRICPECKASNEPDAKFCKECATKLSGAKSDTPNDADPATSEDSP